MQTKKIFKREIALELISRGHRLLYTEPNRQVNGFSVFVFEQTEQLLNSLTEITTR